MIPTERVYLVSVILQIDKDIYVLSLILFKIQTCDNFNMSHEKHSMESTLIQNKQIQDNGKNAIKLDKIQILFPLYDKSYRSTDTSHATNL